MTDREMLSGEFQYLASSIKALWTCSGITLALLVRSGTLNRGAVVAALSGAIDGAKEENDPGIGMLIALRDQISGTH